MSRSVAIVICLCALATGLAVAADVPAAAAAAKQQFDTAVADLQKQHAKTVDAATAAYSKQIDESIARARDGGNLDTVLALKAEQDRVAKGDPWKPGKVPADVTKLHQAYETALAKARAEYEAKARDAHSGLARELVDLEKAETKANRIASAVAVREYRQQLERAGPPQATTGPGDAGRPFGWRFGAEKARLIAAGGGTEESEQAVARGLAWLARQQKPNGSWVYDGSSSADTVAATGMALLPFLAAGETHKSGKKYAQTVDRGLKYLIANMTAAGRFTGKTYTMYTHGIATIALCEAYGMTRDKGLLFRPAQAAVNFMVANQAADGSWGYQPGTAGDTSILGWQIQALKAAQLSNDIVVPNATITKAVAFLDKVSSGPQKAVYGYTTPNGAPGTALTAVGLLCRYSIGKWALGNPGLVEGAEGLLKRGPQTVPAKPEMYYYYYSTLVMRSCEGPEWQDWNEGLQQNGKRTGGMRDWLVTLQNKKDGAVSYGSWDPDIGTIGANCGRIGSTAMSLLTLEVYYRYQPLAKREVPAP